MRRRLLLVACIAMGLGLPCNALAGEWVPEGATKIADLRGGGEFMESRAQQGEAAAKIYAVLVTAADSAFRVIDKPGRGDAALDQAASAIGAVAAVNGGYFTEEFKPVGLLISGGKTLQPFAKAKLLSGVFFVREGKPSIVRADRFEGPASEAIQCGPFLLENGKPVIGLNDVRSARRTIVAEDGKGGWMLGVISGVTLAGAAELLATPGILGKFRPVRAMNLDGGSSTGMFVEKPGSAFYLPPFTSVRNYLAVVPR